ncbi:putative amino acid aldolase or racemase [Galbibacter orientalis DSM 19592]|uniref:Putative amino acid aldolase or racemase n=1 Tax=Galbibacter orientalis DSM 19592 TaxID=926559 RepID=I3C4V9_9FLAO|nr:D-TA family PLP-dependent enzyme [Galbibacter orientalis]EIJ38652.1 putative amino acid aldolase or racemase [Galbibacter orientalis DSM 19592]
MNWYEISNIDTIATPALLVFPERIKLNIQRMLEISGDVNRLRPHTKTHKTAEVIKLQQEVGINKFKCATIAEAELLAKCGAKEILLAMQPVAENINRFFKLKETYPNSYFSTLVDNDLILEQINKLAGEKSMKVGLWMDVNVGMNRTGIVPDEKAFKLFKSLIASENIIAEGFHVYDGHLRNPNFNQRKKDCDTAFEKVLLLKAKLEKESFNVKHIIAGGSPSFPVHALRDDVDLSPGTTLLWDAGYGDLFPEMKMLHAAVLVTRIISKPSEGILCLDLGHKSLASEMPFPRVKFLKPNDFEQISQSEEHFVVKTKTPEKYNIGDVFYAVPMHICPTVAKYQELKVVKNNAVVGTWDVVARNQKITI